VLIFVLISTEDEATEWGVDFVGVVKVTKTVVLSETGVNVAGPTAVDDFAGMTVALPGADVNVIGPAAVVMLQEEWP
jgi:hypothetical protein